MATAQDVREQKKIEKKKALIKNINKFLTDNFKWLIVFVVAMIFILGYFFLLQPKYEQTKTMISVINERRESDYYNKKSELEKIKDLLLSYSKINPSYIKKISSVAPKEIDELFSEINHIISVNGLLIQSLSINEVDMRDPKAKKVNNKQEDYLATGKLGKVKISIRVKGTDYEAFKTLLYSLENNLRLIDVENLNFNPTGQTAELLLATYYTK